MTYEQVLDSPMQRLYLLGKSIPKRKFKKKDSTEQKEDQKKDSNIGDFVKKHGLLK